MPFQVDVDYVRHRVLKTLIGPGARYAGVLEPEDIADRITDAARRVEQRLSTRFELTQFQSFMGPGARPDLVPGTPGTPATDSAPAIPATLPIEYEDPYMWPSMSPGAGYLAWTFNVRPVVQLIGGELVLPGTISPGVQLLPDWFRLAPLRGEAHLMPKYGVSALVLPNLPFGLWQWMAQRIPASMLWTYTAGMTETEWTRYPDINRLVGLRAAIGVLPILSSKINPSGATSSSADGLSVSRKSGYVFEDLEKRLGSEADGIETRVLDAWDGTSSLNVM